ncbi:MAG: M28 family metallopeptidase [Bacteroidetes bacterium]|nr:M28 family metallopeptidase [Bacteroidota bacterium]
MRFVFLLLFFIHFAVKAQDTVYARTIIKQLTSKKCFGRGYLKNGLDEAKKIILKELKQTKAIPYFENNSYLQPFTQSVNVFKTKCNVTLNNKILKLGVDFIPSPDCPTVIGKFNLTQKDSLTYFSNSNNISVVLNLRKKLTYSVSNKQGLVAEIDLNKEHFKEIPNNIELNIHSSVLPNFLSNNIVCKIKGTSFTDSLIVFSAHYDHLGGIGKSVYFPGANDNASGVSFLLNLIKYYSLNPPEYTTVFIFFAGEEAGLLGSKHFVEHQKQHLSKIKFLINLDLLGTGNEGIMVVNGSVFEKEFNLLTQINSSNNYLNAIKKRGKAANSDHYWFTEAGVPAFFVYTLGGVQAYHDVFDIEKTLPLTEYVDVFKLITSFVSLL